MDTIAFNGVAWGKWIALACLVVAALSVVVSVTVYNRRRMQQGATPIRGTGWMLPGYTPAQHDSEGIPDVAAPAYNPNITEHDAGYYDKHGNFIARPMELSTIDPSQLPPGLSATNSHVLEPPAPAARRETQMV